MVTVAIATAAPQKACTPTQLPDFKIAPATGFPTKSPKPAKEKLIPIRVPTTPMLGDRLTTVVGGRDTKVPEKKP